ncbi:MAG: tetratricopeptide repeat protein, partial [Thermodesulfobacteriota bacterium]
MATRESVEGGSQWPVVRLFVSSTFGDMFDEFEVLVKRVFPELRLRCRRRRVRFMEVDLRWGLTQEQFQQGKVIPVCLSAVDDCRPYFLGILGERYGWVPDSLDASLIEQYPWLAGHRGKSVTELEILHGALNDPAAASGAFFYFRDPKFMQGLPLAKRAAYTSAAAEKQRLSDLKARIRASGLPVRENYADADALERFILEDIWPVIEKDLPPPKEEARDVETAQQQAWAEYRTAVYIPREDHFRKLDQHAVGDGPPLVLTGESGVGKSALLANWLQRYKQANPHHWVVVHYIGSSPGSADHVGIMRRIIAALKEHLNDPEEIPAKADEIEKALPVWLAKASAKGRTLLVLDALNQLDEGARDLGWLPGYFFPNVRVVLSTLPGKSLEALERRQWPQYRIRGLDLAEKEALITKVLGGYWKALESGQMEPILTAQPTELPLYLLVLLEELRVFGRYEELNERIRYYLDAPADKGPYDSAAKVKELYDRVLTRWEQAFDKDRPCLVQDCLSLIWAARRGLSEEELLGILGYDGDPLPQEKWRALYLALQDSLNESTDLMTFAHEYVKAAVQEKYLPDEEARRPIHTELAKYFETLDGRFERKVDELPWQLCQAAAWEELKRCVCIVKVFRQLAEEDRNYELLDYWNKLRYLGGQDAGEAYAEMVRHFEQTKPGDEDISRLLGLVANFLQLTAAYLTAEPLYRRALEIRETAFGSEDPDTAVSLNNLAEVLHAKGDYDAAEPLLRRALEIREKAFGPEHRNTATSLNNLAYLLDSKGDYEAAEPLYRRALAIREKVLGPEHPDTATSLNNLAGLLDSKGHYDAAEPLYRRALAIREKVLGQEHPSTATSLNNLAYLLDSKGVYEAAEPL